MQLEPGKLVGGRYRLERRLGEGGMGTVWSATHTVTRRSVALKFLKNALAAPNLRARFLREARAAASVRHAHVVEIYDVFEEDDGTPVMVMEFLVGVSLGEHLDRRGKLEPAELARLMLPTISAVGTAHALGIVHRDLKPDNIFLAGTGEQTIVKVLDFGIAKVADSSIGGNLTNTGTLMGTPQYMSPEQAFGESDLDHRADIFSLGIILYECLSGILPTRVANLGQILKLLTVGGIAPLREVAPSVPPPLLDLVGRMMARAREERPADLGEVYDALAPFAEAAGPAPFGPPSLPLADFDALPPIVPVHAPTELAPAGKVQVTPPGASSHGSAVASASGLAATVASEPGAVPATTPAAVASGAAKSARSPDGASSAAPVAARSGAAATPADIALGDSLDSTVAAPELSTAREPPAKRRAWWLAGASVTAIAAFAVVGLVRSGGGPDDGTQADAQAGGVVSPAPPLAPAVADTAAPDATSATAGATLPAAPASGAALATTNAPSAAAGAPTAPAGARPRGSARAAAPPLPAASPLPAAAPSAAPVVPVAPPTATASSRPKGLVVQPPF